MQRPRRILAIDTATTTQTIALVQDGVMLFDYTAQRRQNHGTTLLHELDHLLAQQRLKPADMDLIAVGLGPGSFTALRVGVANAKALSLACDVPIVGVSTLAAMAYTPARITPNAVVWAGIDARRGEVYAGAYQWQKGKLETIKSDAAYDPAQLAGQLEQSTSSAVWLGFKTQNYDALQDMHGPNLVALPQTMGLPSAKSTAMLAAQRFEAHGPSDLASLEPNYIRPSDAEQSLAKRQANAQ